MSFEQWIPDWLRSALTPAVLWGLSGLSLLLLVASLAGVTVLLKWLPKDYFVHPRPDLRERLRLGGPRYWFWLVLRQLLGLVLLLAGIAMLVLPGQGLLTLLAAMSIAEYPGKKALLALLLRRSAVRRSLNAMRRRAGRPPLEFPS